MLTSRRWFLKKLAALSILPGGSRLLPALEAGLGGSPGARRRLRDLGIIIGELSPGRLNAITDVGGVRVGHCTRIEGSGPLQPGRGPIRTGITAILPNADPYRQPLTAARFTLNGNGEMTGMARIDQEGLLETPIFLTDTSNIGRVMDGAIQWMLRTYPELGHTAPVPVPVVAETWAGFLHDVEGRHLTREHVLQALAAATGGPVAEGVVGGGVGMVCYDFKGGIGTASRLLPITHGGFTIGVLVQANFGSREQLMIDGVPVGHEITDLQPQPGRKSKSIIVIGATDAPMAPVQLRRLCKRMALGLARTGAHSTHGSGDLLLCFSTAQPIESGQSSKVLQLFNDEWSSLAYKAAIEATEEAVLNALCMAETTSGIDGNTAYALPLERLPQIMRKYGR